MTTLRTENLSLKIGTKSLYRNLNLRFAAGQMWGILGPNGSGKTTLLHTLAGILPYTQGAIFADEINLQNMPHKKRAQQIGLLLQDFPDAFAQTVWEYCAAARFPHQTIWQKNSIEHKQIVDNALHIMSLSEYTQHNILHLSGGEKRRLAIAAILAQTPKIYLLDEPTNHLDIKHQIKMLKHFLHLTKEHKAIVCLSLHDINLAQQFCDHILLMGQEEIYEGKTAEVLTPTLLENIFEHKIMMHCIGDNKYFCAY